MFKQRYLVAGGGGFIGSHLCRRLLAQGHEVFCVDNFVTGRPQNVEGLAHNPGFSLFLADIIEHVPEVPRLDGIFHLASPASPPGYKNHPIETLRVNSEGTRRLLELAADHGARLLYCSTSEAYGDPLEHPQRESYRGNVSSTGPRSMYDEAKRYGEALVMAFHRSMNVDTRIVRIFNTYGPMSDPNDGRLVPNFITQALRGEPMTIYGDGSQTRSLCYVSDLVEGLVAMMESPAAAGKLVNLGNPEEHTVLEFAEAIRDLANSSSPFVFCEPAVGDDPQRRRPDISLAQELLGWSPHVGLSDGLSQAISWFRTQVEPQSEANRAVAAQVASAAQR